jgi:hypothetical protein
MPALWNLCTAEEVDTAWGTLIASQKPDEAMENLGMIFSAANLDKITGMFTKIKAGAPPPVFQNVSKLAESMLDAHDWAALKAKVGVK